ncbi:phage tail assembly chaperone [Burkholderia pseudomallei]|uniref:phage tail assembly chaperone n=1 Tax=Burkholderia pseudomallei TaxID=28450 RepID=UPI001E54D4F4|nr:phage tail assembly chaperone [Burkholderia pseudomallei]
MCSSVNRLFFMTSFSPLEAILSSFNWSENSRAGHWIEPLQDAARVTDEDDEPAAREKYERISAAAHSQASARLFVRVVFVKTSSSWQRLFADEDVGAIVTAYGAVHDRVVVKALELGKLNVDPVEDGKKPSAEPQVSAS